MDPSRGQYSGEYVTQLQAANAAALQATAKIAQTASTWKVAAMVGGVLALPLIVIIIYDLIARSAGWRTILLPGVSHFSNYREGMDNQKCYGEPIEAKGMGEFLDFFEAASILQEAGTGCVGTDAETMGCKATKLGTTSSLSEAQTKCSNNPKCTGIVHWDGGMIPVDETMGGNFSSAQRDETLKIFKPLTGYTPYTGSGAITKTAFSSFPPGSVRPTSITFTPTKTCPPPSAPAAPPSVPSTAQTDTTMNTVGSPYSSTYTTPSTLNIPGPTGPTGPTGGYGSGGGMTGAAPPPPLLWEWWYGSGSMAGAVDGTGTTIVSATYAPLSATNQGAYGMQWWMYIKDWNYGYGKEKPIIVRPDTTNSAVMNPRVVLHPTDNSLRISVSVFPSDESGSVSEPAPAGHAGSTDDVFICEVPNIPLQSWFSVSLTVFERNLDVYLNGMLVKSCFMTGVPKPAVGDIQVTPEGGFSGMVCGLTTSNKMINPSDALAFYSSDNSCHTISDKTTAAINTTGYSVKFGVYDTVGRQVREYTF